MEQVWTGCGSEGHDKAGVEVEVGRKIREKDQAVDLGRKPQEAPEHVVDTATHAERHDLGDARVDDVVGSA